MSIESVDSCRFVKMYTERKRDRLLSDEEYRRRGATLGDAGRGASPRRTDRSPPLLMLAEFGNSGETGPSGTERVPAIRHRNIGRGLASPAGPWH